MAITIPLNTVSVDDPVWGPVDRQFAAFNPNNYRTLCVTLHGGGGSIQVWAAQTQLVNLVRQNAVRCGVLFLQGIDYDPVDPVGSVPSIIVDEDQRLPNLSSKQHAYNWNDGRKASFTNANGFVAFDDVLFITQMIGLFTGQIGDLADPYDPDRVFIFGGSNGGHMAQRYAIEKRNLIAGCGAIASTFTFSTRYSTEPGSTPIWFEHGTLDPLNGYHGATRAGDNTAPVINRVAYWKRQNGLAVGARPELTIPIFDSVPNDGCRAVRYDYTSGAAPMVVVEVQNGGHTVRSPRTLPDANPGDDRPGKTCNDGSAPKEMLDWFVDTVLIGGETEPGTGQPFAPDWYPQFEGEA